MKKVIGILALLVFAGNIASAELLKDFKWDGKIIVNGYSTQNDNDSDSDVSDTTSDVDTRVEINVGFNLTEDVDAVVSAVKKDQQYGRAAGQSVSAGTIDQFFFEQAYLNLKGVLGLDHKIGRQYYGEENSLVVYYGPTPWPYTNGVAGNGLSITALDGYTGWYNADKLSLHAIAAKIAANDLTPTGNTDKDLVGVVAKYNLMEVLNIGAYFYEQKEYQQAGAAAGSMLGDETLDVVGVKANGKILGFDYYAEMAKNYGHAHGMEENFTGSAFLAGAKFEIDLVGKWTFMGEMVRGSGDKDGNNANIVNNTKDNEFTEIASGYRPGLIWGGVKGNSGVGNLTSWNLGAKWNTPMFEKLTLSGNLYHYGLTEKVVRASGINTDTIGNELNLCAKWQHNETVGLKAYYGAFMPDSKYAKWVANSNVNVKDDATTLLGAALTVKF